MFEAAQRAYHDAGVDPRTEVDSFVCCSEDLLEGTSIFDEYVPDQLGAMQRPVQTVAADGLFGVATGMMLIRFRARVDRGGGGAQQGFGRPDPRRDRGLRARPGAEPAPAVPDARRRRARHERVPRAHGAVRGALRDGRRQEPLERARQPPRRVPGRARRGRRGRLRPGRLAAARARGRRASRRLRRRRARRRGTRTRAHRGTGVAARRRVGLRQPDAREPDVGRDGAGDHGGASPRTGRPRSRTRRRRSTWPRSTTRTRTRSCSTSRRSGSAMRRASRSCSRRASSSRAATCR